MAALRSIKTSHGLFPITVAGLLALLSYSCSIPVAGTQTLPIAGGARYGSNYSSAGSGQLQTYIVHLRKPAHLVSATLDELEAWHKSYLPSPILDSGEPRMVHSYERAISGFAAKLTPEEVEAMAAKDGFLSAHPDEPLVFETTTVYNYLRLNEQPSLWKTIDFAKGIVVAVIDSGINPRHAAFNDLCMSKAPSKWRGKCDLNLPNKCNNKIIAARNFVSAVPGGEPLDDNGHGSFIASVVGSNVVTQAHLNNHAEGASIGVSPGVYLAIYRAIKTSGLLASFDEAIRMGTDVITVSASLSDSRFYKNDLAIAALSAAEANVFVSCPAGNDGPHSGSVRNGAPWMLTVGASTIDRAFRVILDLGNGEHLYGESIQREDSIPKYQMQLVFPDDGSGMLQTCSGPLTGVDYMVVVCQSDPAAISPKEQGENVQKANGAAMILMNTHLNGSTLLLEDNVLPTVAITHHDSQKLKNYIVTAGVSATVAMRPSGTIYAVNNHPTVASISGRGPSKANGGILKPDIIGPGVNIVGASHLTSNSYVAMSGTSVSTAVLASVASMVKKVHPSWSPASIRSAIMTSSIYLNNDLIPIQDQKGAPAGAFAIGAGHVHPKNAILNPGLVYDIKPEDYLMYLCGLPGYTQREVDIVAGRSVDCTRLGKLGAEELNYPSITVMLSSRTKTVTRTVRNEGPGRSTYMADVKGMPAGVMVAVKPDVLNFVSQQEEQSFAVTFSAAHGSQGRVYQGQLIWSATISGHVVRSPLVVTVR